MRKTIFEIFEDEKIVIPYTKIWAKRVQRYKSSLSIDFELDEKSTEFLQAQLPFKCTSPLLKKIAENIVILNRQKHRKTDISRLELMQLPKYRFHNDSFYYSVE